MTAQAAMATDHVRGVNYGLGCRCDRCRTTHNVHNWAYRERNADLTREAARRGETRVIDGLRHGISGYRNAHCRCEVCRAANKAACVAYRKRRKAVSRA